MMERTLRRHRGFPIRLTRIALVIVYQDARIVMTVFTFVVYLMQRGTYRPNPHDVRELGRSSY